MGLWSYPIPEGGKRMTLIKLPIKISKTAPAKTHIHSKLTGNEDLTHRPSFSPEYGCDTMIATNMHYFSPMPSGVIRSGSYKA